MNPVLRHRLLIRSVLLAAGLLAVIANAPVNAARPLPEFTGYTRIGYPNSEGADDKAAEKVAPVAREAKAIGVTVYYMVLDRRAASSRGTASDGDTFGTGIKDFDNYFIAGRNADRRHLDTRVRYLYLYQVVNDSGREAAVRNTSIRLIIEPRLISSWGHFSERREEKGVDLRRGLGFTSAFSDPGKGDSMIRPVSTENVVGDKAYRTPAPPVRAPAPWGLTSISVNQRLTAPGEDVGKEPEAVVLVANWPDNDRDQRPAFRDQDQRTAFRSSSSMEGDRLLYPGETRAVRVPTHEKWDREWPCIRAYWNEEDPIKPRQRSTIFGFTSDYPPVYRETEVIGRSLGIGFGAAPAEPSGALAVADAAGEERTGRSRTTLADATALASLRLPFDFNRLPGQVEAATGTPPAIGTVPTPVPPARVTPAAAESGGGIPPAPVGSMGESVGPLGGGGPTGGGMAGGGMPGGGMMGGGGTQGGGGGMMGGGGGQQGQGDQGKQDQNNADPDTQGQGNVISNVVNVKVDQKQQQQQQQKQQQQQGQQQGQSQSGGGGGTVIPAPPAWILGLLGAPVFLFLKRRRNQAEPTQATSAATES